MIAWFNKENQQKEKLRLKRLIEHLQSHKPMWDIDREVCTVTDIAEILETIALFIQMIVKIVEIEYCSQYSFILDSQKKYL